jgi:hypothetical protein
MAGEEWTIDRSASNATSGSAHPNYFVAIPSSEAETPVAPAVIRRSPDESLVDAALKTGTGEGEYLALAAGERLELCEGLHLAESARQAIFVGCGEMVVMDHIHALRKHHFRLPGATDDGTRRTVTSVIASIIHRKPIGFRSLGNRFLIFLDKDNEMIGRLDCSVDYGHNSSGTWEFNTLELERMCTAVGVSFRVERYETAQEFLAKRPEWVPPEIEFEADHLRTERVREWGLAVAIALPIAAGLSVLGSFLIFVGPVGWFVGMLEGIGVILAVALTIWGHSKWRMKRSLRQTANPTI